MNESCACRPRPLPRCEFRFGYDLKQGRAGAVQVYRAQAGVALVYGFAGVFFQVGAGHADAFVTAGLKLNINMAPAHDRRLELADLIALGQVGIK